MVTRMENTISLSTNEAKIMFPDVAKARRLLRQHPGEPFCELSRTGIAVGIISDDPEPISLVARNRGESKFYSAYAEIRTSDGVFCSLDPSGRSGRSFSYKENPAIPETPFTDEYSMYLGSYNADEALRGTLANGHHSVFESQRIEEARKLHKIHGTRLVIGEKACGAYALGMALAELDANPKNMDISTGLRIADMLERQPVSWRPRGFEGRNGDEAISTLQEAFVDNAIMKLVLAKLALGSKTDIVSGSVGRRISIFSYDRAELCERLLTGINESSDERVLSDLHRVGLECEPKGDSETYLRTAISNILTHQLGIG